MIKPRSILAAVLVLAGIGGMISAGLSIARSNAAQSEGTPVAAMAKVPAASSLIGALGTVEPPGGAVSVAPSASGVVAMVLVSPGDQVAAGEALFSIDDRLARAKVDQLRASVKATEAALSEVEGTIPVLEAAVDIGRANLAAAEARRDDAAEDLATAEQLLGAGNAVSRRDVERRRTALRAAEAEASAARAALAQARAELAQVSESEGGTRLVPLRAAIAEARAALATAEAELQLLTIASPFDARVLEVNVRAGEFAAAGSEGAAAIVLGRTGRQHVRAQIEEADLVRFTDGASAQGLQRGSDGTPIRLTFVRREPLLRPKTTLSGGATERIDTRVLEVLYETEDASLMPGQLVDVLIGAEFDPAAAPP
jgi:HlyD family secretion protein